nr:PREDICTED: uncharacterized protein LOC109041427 [Bemisia tabaci]
MEELFSAAEECLHRAEFCIIEEDELQLSALYPKLESIFRALGNIYANESDGDVAEISNFFLNQVTDILEIIEEVLKHPTEAGVRLPKTANNGPGRPSYIIPEEEVKMLKNTGLAWTKIADFFNVSAKTLKRRMKASNLQLVERKTNIQDHDLDVVLRDIIDEHPSSGYTYVWASLKARNIFVPFRRVITRMKVLDPIGIFLRSRRRILRRKFKVKASRYLW